MFIYITILNNLRHSVVKLLYTDNVRNEKAVLLPRCHGVVKTEPAVESGLSLKDRRVLRYYIRYELGWCYKRATRSGGERSALSCRYTPAALRLLFACKKCCMISIDIFSFKNPPFFLALLERNALLCLV